MTKMAASSSSERLELVRGSYKFFHKAHPYAEEHFKLFQNFDDQSLTFSSQIRSLRKIKGEIFHTKVTYTVDKKYLPLYLCVKRNLGRLTSKEFFIPNESWDRLFYRFESKNYKKETKLQTPNKYHLANPAICSVLSFSKREQFNSSISKNFNIITSVNFWEYKRAPESRVLSLKCLNPTEKENLTIAERKLIGTRFETFLKDNNRPGNKISYFLSDDYAIPYQVIADENVKMEVESMKKSRNTQSIHCGG